MKKLILTILLVVLTAAPAAALSPQQQVLLQNIFISELDYREIQDRWNVLNNKPVRTPEEDFIMLDYAKKLTHDVEYMQLQIANLKAAGVNFGSETILNVRRDALEILRLSEQAEIDNILAMRASIQADPNIPDEEKAILLNELAGRVPGHENRKLILNALKAGAITWNLD